MRINKHDTQGTKPLLGKGELGYDDYAAGGDTGRVYVGTGTENIALAERLESNMMTKVQFNALAEERKANRGGSGFDEWGKHASNNANINQGMQVPPAPAAYQGNTLYLGQGSYQPFGISRTSTPYICVNGGIHKIDNINRPETLYERNIILLPTAPNIYPHDTVLTTEQINSGVIKHADASNSGLIVNGKFDTDTSGWSTYGQGGSISQVSGRLKTQSISDRGRGYQYLTNLVVGKKYVVEAMVASDGVVEAGLYCSSINNVGAFDYGVLKATISETTLVYKKLEFTATTTNLMLCCTTISSGVSSSYSYFDNIAVYPADAISRSDLVFLESWHEDISEKNFVYPLGNVQYLGGNTDGLTGITNGNFTGFETYSLFGNWITPSSLIGKGYVWSSLTEAQKRAFIANSENNCYLDGDKVIQVRYRVRVAMGLGDNWDYASVLYNAPLQYNGSMLLKPKGKSVSISSDLGSSTGGIYVGFAHVFTDGISFVNGDCGIAQASSGADILFSGAHEGKCFALPLALVHRRNQGMYHPVYNPNGSKKASDNKFWYDTSVSFASISDCFDPAKLLTASGYIGSVSGRPDGLFYDQVHEGDIQDLRNSSKKVEDYSKLREKEFNKLVAGTNRGKEGEKITEIKTQTTTGTVATVEINDGTKYKSGDVIYIYDLTASTVKGRFVIKSISSNTLTVDTTFAKLANSYMISGASSTRTKSNTLLVCDIIGNPANYPTVWKTNEVNFTTLHTAEDGTSLLPDGVRDTFKLSRKANDTPLLCLRSTDNGANWTSFTPTFSTATNSITLTNEPARNLVVVYYQTYTSMATPTVNSEVLEYGKALGTNGLSNARLVSTLIGKVSTANIAPYLQMGYDINGFRIDTSTIKWSTTSTEIPVHNALSLGGGASGVATVKVLPYLTRLNGKAYLNLVFKEMKHNGTSWGDSGKFEIVDNVSTTTDNNAQTVLIGQKTVELSYFIAGDE